MPDSNEIKDIKIQREKIKNAEMIAKVVKVWLDDFKYLITIVVLVLVTLSNLGWLTYGAITKTKPKVAFDIEQHSSLASLVLMQKDIIAPDLKLLKKDVMKVEDYFIGGSKIGALVLNIGLLVFALYLRKKDKEKKAKKDAESKDSNSKIVV